MLCTHPAVCGWASSAKAQAKHAKIHYGGRRFVFFRRAFVLEASSEEAIQIELLCFCTSVPKRQPSALEIWYGHTGVLDGWLCAVCLPFGFATAGTSGLCGAR